jgi:ABC-type transport system involved in cytochrome c biogenesis permease subunit
MASNTLADGNRTTVDRTGPRAGGRGLLKRLLSPLASLRLTVALFALSIVLIFAGTLAQVDKDIWEVMGLYFRAWFAWIPLQIFFPPSFFGKVGEIPGGFYFPGGFLIGSAMAVNLLAAHGVRFTVQARGARLSAGLATLALGVLVTWAVVLGGSDKEVVEASKGLRVDWLWGGIEAALAMVWLSTLYTIWELAAARVWERRLLILAASILGIVLGVVLYEGSAIMPDPSAMRILWQLLKATSAALVLLAGCVLVFRKRAGIVLLHAGVGLMMANELVVYSLHAEGMMALPEGQETNYVEDARAVELAVTSPAEAAAATKDSASGQDRGTLEDVIVVPKRQMPLEKVVRNPLLPFDVELLKYYPNSKLREVVPEDDNPATAGAGRRLLAEPIRASTGTDMDQTVDMAAGYVKLFNKADGQPIGTYLVSQNLLPQPVVVDGKSYDLLLRFKRTYKPYTVRLIDVRRDNYLGTNTAKNFSSDVQLIDPVHGVDRKIHIWMNNPLRYAGDTFYQSSYREGNPEVSTLQVVENTGWMIPYVGCMIVAVGMLAHFSLTLTRFLKRRDAEELAEEEHLPIGQAARAVEKPRQRKTPARLSRPGLGWKGLAVPALVVLTLAGWLMGKASTPHAAKDSFDYYQFGKLPLVCEGRVKPMDTLARNSLLFLSGKQTVKEEAPAHPWWKFWVRGPQHSATEWMLEAACHTKASFGYRIFRIVHPEVLELLHLEPRKGLTYSAAEIQPHIEDFIAEVNSIKKFQKEAIEAGRSSTAELSIYQKKLLELGRQLQHYQMLVEALSPPPLRQEHMLEDLKATVQHGFEIADDKQVPLIVPPESAEGPWQYFPVAWVHAQVAEVKKELPNPATITLDTMLYDYGQGKPEDFNRSVESYQRRLAAAPPAETNLTKVGYEAWFDHFEPFYYALYLDLTAFVLTMGAWFGWNRLLNRTAFWVLVLTLAVHTLGLVSRIYISGRPPIINLYSDAVFIGWAGMIAGLALEVIYRLGIGNLIASVAGFATLLIAHFLASGGDTLIVLQAVLDTQFWLATHVVCVTLGYTATFVAGLLGIVYIAHSAATRGRQADVDQTLARMTYGTLCFAIFFSFVGTVLGGLWADDSWGRFWGWDPKENGALMIVAWNALVLHARWGKMVADRGLAMLAVWGNAITAWSFFGVNELGVGLHSYGFTEGVSMWLGIWVLAQIGVIAFAIVDGWRGHSIKPAAA